MKNRNQHLGYPSHPPPLISGFKFLRVFSIFSFSRGNNNKKEKNNKKKAPRIFPIFLLFFDFCNWPLGKQPKRGILGGNGWNMDFSYVIIHKVVPPSRNTVQCIISGIPKYVSLTLFTLREGVGEVHQGDQGGGT